MTGPDGSPGSPGWTRLQRLHGVDGVEEWLAVGDLVNPHEGDYSAVARAWSWAAQPLAVAGNDRRIRDNVAIELTPMTDDASSRSLLEEAQ